MLASDSKSSLFKKLRIWVTLLFFAMVITITAILIWSYSQLYQYVKLLVLVAIDLDPSDDTTGLFISDLTDIDPSTALLSQNFRIEITEFELDFNSIVKNFWDSTAYSPALALIASMYIYPYLKLLVYLIVFFVPLKPEYQYRAIFHLNQWNKLMYIPLVAILVQCSTFSFTIQPPTEILQNATDVKAEAYPGIGTVILLIVILCYAITDYLAMIMIKSNHRWIVPQPRLQINNIDGGASSAARSDIDARSEFVIKYQIKQRYLSSSYLGIVGKSLFMAMIFINIYLVLESINTATLNLTLDGVLSKFVPDVHVINNMLQGAQILLDTSLLNDTAARFIYGVYIIVFVVCPCIITISLSIIWIIPIFNKKLGFEIVPKYILPVIWWIQSWNALDIFFICQFGATQHNMEYGTKYLLDNKFPQYCGDQGLVTKIFGMDCSWADCSFTYGLLILALAVIFTWISMYYTNKIFGNQLEDTDYRKLNDVHKKMSINT